MAIYKLIPALKDYIWGGTNLKKYRKTDLDIISESWELSFHQDGLSKVEIDNKLVNLSSVVKKEDLGEKVKITVEDTGIGIEEKYHKYIFDRFNQIVDSSMETKGGSGLGLTITKHIIDMHNGEIYIESEVDKGTKFTIILPADRDIDKSIVI